MKTKPYPQMEEKPTVANEPAVAYEMTARLKAVFDTRQDPEKQPY